MVYRAILQALAMASRHENTDGDQIRYLFVKQIPWKEKRAAYPLTWSHFIAQIISARVVLADGSCAVASADLAETYPGQPVSGPDLLWALRGGGAGTAVVYEWKLAVYPAPSNVSVCYQYFNATTEEEFRQLVNQLFAKWSPATDLSSASYPFAGFHMYNESSKVILRVNVAGWEVSTETVNDTITFGMHPFTSFRAYCETFPSWYDYMVYFAFNSYYGNNTTELIKPDNFTISYQLSSDYLGWLPGPFPQSPFVPYDAINPAVKGPWAFRSQGIFSYSSWSNATITKMFALIRDGLYIAGSIMGGALTSPVGPSAADGVGSAAATAWSEALYLIQTTEPAFNTYLVKLADASGVILDADHAPEGAGRRFYNFLNCYNLSSTELFDLYYGKAKARLASIKFASRASGRLTTWCDV